MKKMFNKNFINLIIGELKRAIRYKVLTIGLLVSLLWLIIIFFVRDNLNEVSMLIPLFIFTDAAVMSVMLIGASIYFEKQEGSIKSVLVSPVGVWQILIAKLINSVAISLISALIVGLGAIFMTDIKINIPLLLMYVAITVVAHSAIGFALSMTSKDFNAMLVNFMLFMVIFVIPPILIILNVIPSEYEIYSLISPSQAANTLLNSAVQDNSYKWYEISISIVYLLTITVALMKFFVQKRFQKDAMRG
ncbi:MAG: ABC transporter permease [Bacillota bacterium]